MSDTLREALEELADKWDVSVKQINATIANAPIDDMEKAYLRGGNDSTRRGIHQLRTILAAHPADGETEPGFCPAYSVDLEYPTAQHILDCPPITELDSACEFCGFKDDNAGSKYWRCSQCGCEDFEMVPK